MIGMYAWRWFVRNGKVSKCGWYFDSLLAIDGNGEPETFGGGGGQVAEAI